MRVNVYKARRDHLAVSIELPSTAVLDDADRGDPVAVDRDIRDAAGAAGPVDNEPTANHQIMNHRRSLAPTPRPGSS